MNQQRRKQWSAAASRIALCLFLGALTTIAVAWVAAASIDWTKAYVQELSTNPNNAGDFNRAVSIGPAHLRISNTNGFAYDVGNLPVAPAPGWSMLNSNEPKRPPYFEEAAYGWPALSLRCWCQDEGKPAWPRMKWGIPIARLKPVAIPYNAFFGNLAGAFPLHSNFPGFMIDAAVFAACWAALLFTPGIIKRALRRPHGLCPRCAYDLRADFTQGCPECGWARQTRAVREAHK